MRMNPPGDILTTDLTPEQAYEMGREVGRTIVVQELKRYLNDLDAG